MPEESGSNLDKDSLYVVTSSTRIAILKLLIEKKHLTVTDIAKKLNLSKSTVHEHLEKLVTTGLITKSEISGKKWIYYKPTWQGYSLFPKKDRMQINVVLSVVLMIAVSVVLAAVLYVWAAGLASTGGSAPPAFSASVTDATDNITASTTNKNLGILTGTTFTAGSTIAPRPYASGGVAFVLAYSGTALTSDVWVNVTYENEKGETKTTTMGVKIAKGLATASGYYGNFTGSDIGVKKVTAITTTVYTGASVTYTLGSTDKIYVNTTNYDTICKITADNGKPGDITKLTFYIKIGTTGDWKKLTPDTSNPYVVGALVLDNAALTTGDTVWDVGESAYISEVTTTGNGTDLITSNADQVYVKVVHEPSSSTIYESKTAVNVF